MKKIFHLFTFLLSLFFIVGSFYSCSTDNPSNSNDNPNEVSFRLNGVHIYLPKGFKKIMDLENVQFEDQRIINIFKSRVTKHATYFVKEKDSIVVSVVQLATRGRRIEINGENYRQFMDLVKTTNQRFTNMGLHSELIEDSVESQAATKYFKVKNKITAENKTSILTGYLLTNDVRSSAINVLNFDLQDDDLEDFIKRTMLY